MNPLASTKCASRVLMALAAISGIFLMAGCSSSSSTVPPNQQGFSNSSLTGTYVISIAGTDVNTTANEAVPFAIVGTVTANGSGGITGGTLDLNDPGNIGVQLGQAVGTNSGYSITQDGRGSGTLVTPVGSFNIDFVLSSISHGLISRFDNQGTDIGTGSGTIDLQSGTTQGSLASLAFSLSGADPSGYPLATVGGFALNTTTGAITTGLQDFNDNGISSVSGLGGLNLGGSVVIGASGTTGTATLSTSSAFGALNFDVWVIDSTHLKFIETDQTGVLLAGDAFPQLTSFTPGQLVFTLGGLDSSLEPVVAGGYVTTTAYGNLSNGTEDYNDAATGNANTISGFSGTCNANAPFLGGRCELTLSGFSNGSLQSFIFAAYPSSGGTQLLEIDSLGLLQGAAYSQTATSFTASEGYAYNLSG
ncbi:MAG: hypothetical protein ACLPVW_01350 [Terriglobales bacterium]